MPVPDWFTFYSWAILLGLEYFGAAMVMWYVGNVVDLLVKQLKV